MTGPIGLFDSGLGGLSVARVLFRRMPHESLWVIGDTVHVPYGGKPLSVVHDYAMGLTEHLVDGGCRAVVMACNISSAVALDDARMRFPVPVFGMVDAGSRAAITADASDRIGVLTTEGTLRSGAYNDALTDLRPSVHVRQVACPAFVPLVESGAWASDDAFAAAREYAAPLIDQDIRTIILGCTHYPFLADAIRAAFPYPVKLVDPAESVADELEAVVGNNSGESPNHRFEATADPEGFAREGSRLLDQPFTAKHCTVWQPARELAAR